MDLTVMMMMILVIKTVVDGVKLYSWQPVVVSDVAAYRHPNERK
jgi:hypothetical protein